MNGEHSPAKAWRDDRQWSAPITDSDFRARVFAAIDQRYRVWIGDAQTKHLGYKGPEPETSLSWDDLTNETTTLRRGFHLPFFGDRWIMLLCTIGGTSAFAERWFYVLYCDDNAPAPDVNGDEPGASDSQRTRPRAIIVDWELQTLVDWIQEAALAGSRSDRLRDGPITEDNVIEYVKFALAHDLSLAEGELCRPVENADDLLSSKRFSWSKDDPNSSAAESAVKLANIEPMKVIHDPQTRSNLTFDEGVAEIGQRTKRYKMVGHFVIGDALYRRTFEVTNLGELRFDNPTYAERLIAHIPVPSVSDATLADAGYLCLERFAEEWRFAPPRHINDLLEAMADNEQLEIFRREAEQALQIKRRNARLDIILARANDPCSEGEDVRPPGENRPIPIVCEAPSTNIGKPYSSQITHLHILFKHRVEFRACTFEGPVDFSNCRFMKGLAITGCMLKGKLDLRNCEISYTGTQTREEADRLISIDYPAALDLSFSSIQQDVDLQGAVLKTLYRRLSFNAQHLRLEGSLNLKGLHSNGGLNIAHASIGGTVLCGQGESRLRRPRISVIDGSVDLSGAHIYGYVYVQGLVAEKFEARRARFDGTVFFRCTGFGDVIRTQFRYGLVLRGAHIKGQLQLQAVICGSRRSDTEDDSVEACDVEVEEDVIVQSMWQEDAIRQALKYDWFDNVTAVMNLSTSVFGGFNFSGAKLRGGIFVTSAKITGKLDLSHASIDGDIYLGASIPFNPCGALQSGPLIDGNQFGENAWPTFDLLEVGGMIDCRHAEIGGSVYVQGIVSGHDQSPQKDAVPSKEFETVGLDFQHTHIGGSYISLDEDWINGRQDDFRAILDYCQKKLEERGAGTPSTSLRASEVGTRSAVLCHLFGNTFHGSNEASTVVMLPPADVLKAAAAVKSGNKICGDLNFSYARIDGAAQIDNSDVSGRIILSDAVIRGDVKCSWPSWMAAPPGYDISPSWCGTKGRSNTQLRALTRIRRTDERRMSSGVGRTICSRFEMVGLSCLADVDLSGLVIDLRIDGYSPTSAESTRIGRDERTWPSLDGRRASIAGSLQLARRCPAILDASHGTKVYAAIRGQLNLSYARAGQLVLDGTSFQNGVRSARFRDTLNRILGWPRSVYRNDIGESRWLSRKDAFESYGVALDRGEFGRLTLEGDPRIPRLIDIGGIHVTRWDLEVRDFIELLESAFAFRFDRDNYLLVQRELRNEGKDADAARVFDMLRSHDTAIIRQWGQARADYLDRMRQTSQSPLWPLIACVLVPYLTLRFLLRTLLLVPIIRLWTTLGERALFGNFLHAGRPLLWALMAFWFACSVSIFLNPQNLELQTPPSIANQERLWSLSDAVWVSLRYHIPPINLAIRPSIMPSSKPLRLPVWFASAWNWCAEYLSERQPVAGRAHPKDDSSITISAMKRAAQSGLPVNFSNRVRGASAQTTPNSNECEFPTCWNAITAEDYAGITELVHWILVPLLLTIWVATVVQRRSSAMGN